MHRGGRLAYSDGAYASVLHQTSLNQGVQSAYRGSFLRTQMSICAHACNSVWCPSHNSFPTFFQYILSAEYPQTGVTPPKPLFSSGRYILIFWGFKIAVAEVV